MKTRKLQLYTTLFAIVLICSSAVSVNARTTLKKGFPSPSIFARPKDNPSFSNKRGLTTTQKSENKDTIVTNKIKTTYDTIIVQGIPCTIVYSLEWTYVKKLKKTLLTAETYNFYAWDNKGNVWEFGQDSFKYLYNNKWRRKGISTKGSWLAGKNKEIPRIAISSNSKK